MGGGKKTGQRVVHDPVSTRKGSCKAKINPLSDKEIEYLAKFLKIDGFRGVFMRDTLPAKRREKECFVLNLDDSSGDGTHWVSCWVEKDECYYFDPIGDVLPLQS